jgi:hypothetical protein
MNKFTLIDAKRIQNVMSQAALQQFDVQHFALVCSPGSGPDRQARFLNPEK